MATGSLALGGFAWLSVSRVETHVANFSDQNAWYKYYEPPFYCYPTDTDITFSVLTITFELRPNESIYFSFTAQTFTDLVASDWSRVTVFFKVDGIVEPDPSAEVGMYNGGFATNFMIHLQTVRHDLSSGIHNVTVVIRGYITANYVSESTLFAQKVLL